MKRLVIITLFLYVFCRNTGIRVNDYSPSENNEKVYTSYIQKLSADPKNKAIISLDINQFRSFAKETGFVTCDENIDRLFKIMDKNNNSGVEKEEFVKARTDEDYRNNIIIGGLVIFIVTKFQVQTIYAGLLYAGYWGLIYILNNLADIDL